MGKILGKLLVSKPNKVMSDGGDVSQGEVIEPQFVDNSCSWHERILSNENYIRLGHKKVTFSLKDNQTLTKYVRGVGDIEAGEL